MANSGEDVMAICEAWIRNMCAAYRCPHLHVRLPYMWQIHLDNVWISLPDANEAIEEAFSIPDNDTFQVQTLQEVQGDDRMVSYSAQLAINFSGPLSAYAIVTQMDNPSNSFSGTVQVRRLSTRSYVHFPEDGQYFGTVWTWRWKEGHTWKTIGKDSPIPMQSVLELKYLLGQEVYRFEYEEPDTTNSTVFLIDLRSLTMSNQTSSRQWHLQRRPLYVSSAQVHDGIFPSVPPRKHVPFSCSYPENWAPLDPQFDYELVPLNPDNMEYHLIASEVQRSLPHDRNIQDIFRIQNPYLWHKFESKKKQFQAKDRDPNEQQLFHGTSDSNVVKAIFQQNFDWRVCGKNATMFGKGAYFAKDAAYSDRYTGPEHTDSIRWLFMARVLVGTYTVGAREITRPPPRDPNKPYSDLYDSCVNDLGKPKIFVLFDTDQYYPEYVISYKHEPPNAFQKT